jgi:hypothetical protein
VCINENVLKDLFIAAEDGGKDKIATATAISFKKELPHIPFHQVKGFKFFISVDQIKLLL